ncbi:pyruvate formate-lyase-activating protein [Bacillus marinisedimentorum]|uniref:pyruvate formate-lyase-activating protein n=1 Tax=Bacillus marinisedimentorum TaxID=1821260 RepID=UPI0007E038A3|nr:pyruvate formate-lyase-activating protein [Bacillus marinisedimentorum]
MKGRIHSVETLGTVDGPGLRYIVFTQGCPLRCLYCHNPDTWERAGGNEADSVMLINEVRRYLPYMKASGGGITVSGGEPLLQPEFVLDLFKQAKAVGINTALDTAGSIIPANIDELLEYTDLVLLDVKHVDDDGHRTITGQSNHNNRKFAAILEKKGIPVWIRHVLLPGYTDGEDTLRRLGKYAGSLSNVKKIEVLPYHKMGDYKWEALGLTNKLQHVEPPTAEEAENAYKIITNI